MKSTIAAISTGQAPGGIGIIRISGPDAVLIADKVFLSKYGKRLSDMRGYMATFGAIYNRFGEKIDDCVATVFLKPKSYTGENVVELSCHGGLFVTREVLRLVFEAGAEPANSGEFTKRAFLNGKIDLTEAEAVMGLISAKGKEAARIAKAAGEGRLSKRINAICFELESLLSHLSAWADFPDEDVDEVNRYDVKIILKRCQDLIIKLLEGYDHGRIFREGLRVVIVGKPNVGKSTLMNCLLGYERSIVTPYAGTTRDIVEDSVTIGGIPLILADTAGIRSTNDPIEEIGVAAARSKLVNAQLVFAVFDWSRELTNDDMDIINSIIDIPSIAIINKSDLDQMIDLDFLKEKFSNLIVLSARMETGIDNLENELQSLFSMKDFDPENGELFTDRQRFVVKKSLSALSEGISAINMGMTFDAITVCIEDSLGALYELTGRKVNEEIIDSVFKNFCVGK